MQSIINPENEPAKSKDLRTRPFYAGFLFFAAILLPVVSFTIEITTGWCADVFFDPMPTWWHVLLVAFVPITNFQTWRAVRNKRTERLAWHSFANALVVFISLFYTIVYAPLFPISVIALLFAGLGILGMTPMFALLGTLLLRRELKKLISVEENTRQPFGLRWLGLGAAFLIILALVSVAELPFTLTKVGINMAASADAKRQSDGLHFLRRYGSEDYLLRSCYNSSGMITLDFFRHFWGGGDLFWSEDNKPISPEKAREIYYRLHGKHYNQVAPPRGVKHWERVNVADEFDAESNRINQGLSLSASTIDGSVDGDAAVGYLEWTLVVKNDKSWQQEAVANIQLPPNAVVSRLTLWINGEEREAAFAGRERVTQAYNAVTARRRDPVLVTTAGRDKIAVRAFPVPPNGEMKFRIGISVPLHLENESHSLLLLPHFNERNFTVPTEHSIWIESKKSLEAANPAFTLENRRDLSAVRGKVSNEDLSKTGAPVRAAKSPEVKTAWTRLAPDSDEIVRQEIVESTDAKPAGLVFVVDTGANMKPFQNEIAASIKSLPSNVNAALVLTNGNGLNVETAAPHSFTGNAQEIAAKIENAYFGGGADSIPALEKAWDVTETMPNSAIVWIHAPQPLKLSPAESLKQRFMRRPSSSLVYSLQIVNGANTAAKEIDGFGKVRSIPRFGKLGDDLNKFLSDLNQSFSAENNQPNRRFTAVRTVDKIIGIQNLSNTKETSAHLVRLWANEEAARLLENNEDHSALLLSVKHQLVTPVSGAVVLETQEQYEQFGLRPVEPNTVPTIPEPEEYLLFAVVTAILMWLFRRYRKAHYQVGKGLQG